MPRVVFSEDLRADIANIAEFSLDRFGRAQAKLYVQGLRAACRRLGDFPGMVSFDPIVRPPTRRLVHRSHRVFYNVEAGRVLILRILHHAQATPPAL